MRGNCIKILLVYLTVLSSLDILAQSYCIDELKCEFIASEMHCIYSTRNDTINGFYKIVSRDSIIEEGYIEMGYRDGLVRKSVGDDKELIEEYDMRYLKRLSFIIKANSIIRNITIRYV